MRVFVAGASGAIGTRLVPQLISAGHRVGTARTAQKAEQVRAQGAEAVTLDLLDAPAVREAVRRTVPEAIIHQATAIADARFGRSLDKTFLMTNRLRTEGTDALVSAARQAGVTRIVAQSFAPYRYAREGAMIKTVDDRLDPAPPQSAARTHAAMRYLDETVIAAGGIVLRYGGFYGGPADGLVEPIRKGMFPIVGDGGGYMSFVHLDDAAAATVLALTHNGPATYHVVEPAPIRDWLPVLADALGAKPPRHFPRWFARLLAGDGSVVNATEARGASNAKAKRELGWAPQYPSWREGFAATYAQSRVGETRGSERGAGRAEVSRVSR